MTYRKQSLQYRSKWSDRVLNDYFTTDSDTLVVMLPGYGYTVEGPLFYYLTGMCIELKFDVIQVNYGFQVARCDIDYSNDVDTVLKEIKTFLAGMKTYSKVIIIGKSMGTGFIDDLSDLYQEPLSVHLTPTDLTLTEELNERMFVIYGSADSMLSEASKNKLAKKCKRLIISNGDHSLEVGHVHTDLDNMKQIMKSVRSFVSGEE